MSGYLVGDADGFFIDKARRNIASVSRSFRWKMFNVERPIRDLEECGSRGQCSIASPRLLPTNMPSHQYVSSTNVQT